jgi:hypothetical protein
VFVTGRISSVATFYDYVTLKYSSAGLPVWTNFYNGPGNGVDEPEAIGLDAQNNVFVTGYSVGADASWDFATIKYSNTGVPIWTNRYGAIANGSDVATALVLDAADNVLVTGFSDGGASSYDIATVAYSNDGLPLATNRYNGAANKVDQANAIAVDSVGNYFVTGLTTTDASGNDFITIKYSAVSGPRLNSQNVAGAIVLTWTSSAFVLQAAATIDGIFTNVPGASSPYTNSTLAASELFFRLISK